MDRPICEATVGSRSTPLRCGEAAVVRLATSGGGVDLCGAHAVLCQEQTGATIVVEHATESRPSRPATDVGGRRS